MKYLASAWIAVLQTSSVRYSTGAGVLLSKFTKSELVAAILVLQVVIISLKSSKIAG